MTSFWWWHHFDDDIILMTSFWWWHHSDYVSMMMSFMLLPPFWWHPDIGDSLERINIVKKGLKNCSLWDSWPIYLWSRFTIVSWHCIHWWMIDALAITPSAVWHDAESRFQYGCHHSHASAVPQQPLILQILVLLETLGLKMYDVQYL